MLTLEVLELRDMLDGIGILTTGDTNHDGSYDNRDVQAAIVDIANAYVARPTAAGTYQQPTAPLFATGGPIYTEPVQGGLNDCGLIAALSEEALKNPAAVRAMFQTNYDGTYTFHYFELNQPYLQNGIPQTTIIDTALPTGGYASYKSVTWPALAEKAMAQIHGAYDKLNFAGSFIDWESQLTGTKWLFPFGGIHDATDSFDAGNYIGLVTGYFPDNPAVSPDHCYAMTGYDAAAQTMTLYNPLGYSQTFSYADISNPDNFASIQGSSAT